MVALLAGASLAKAASSDGVTLYLQLIQGTDAETPPAAGATLVGDSLGRRLQMFRWKNYWEVKRQTVQLTAGSKIRRQMTSQRDVEIAWTAPGNLTVSIYLDGKLTRKRAQPVDTAFYIAGGDDGGGAIRGSSWCAATNPKTPPRRKRNHRSAIHTSVPSGSLS